MADGVVFDKQSAVRIADVVQRVERWPLPDPSGKRRNVPATANAFMAQLTSDCAYNATATVQVLAGAVGSEAPNSSFTLSAHNMLYRKLWSGARVLLTWAITEDSGGMYRITWSDSASRVRGTAAAAINASGSGTVNSITLIDGRVGLSSLTAFNVLVNFNISSGAKCWCEWTQANNRWEIYAADCPPP